VSFGSRMATPHQLERLREQPRFRLAYVLKKCQRCCGNGWRKRVNSMCVYCTGSGFVTHYRLSARTTAPPRSMIQTYGFMLDGVFTKTKLTTVAMTGQTSFKQIRSALRNLPR
jgi:hypothetical protein